MTGADRRGVRPAARLHRSGSLHRPAGRQALRRHEAEARARLRLDPHAQAAAPGRAERGRRSDLPARAVEHGLRPGRPGHRRGVEHRLSRRGRALRPGDPPERGEGARRRAARRTDGTRRGTKLPRPGRGRGPAQGPGHGPQASRNPRRRHPGSERPAGRPPGLDAARPRRASGSTGSTIKPVAPRFEDAFIDLLGGVPKTESPLAGPRRGQRWRWTGRRGPRADQAIRRLHGRRSDQRSGSAGARSSACSAPTARASRPRSR